MKQQWQPVYPGNEPNGYVTVVEHPAMLSDCTGCGCYKHNTRFEGGYGSEYGGGYGSGIGGGGSRGGGWGNSMFGWFGGDGDCDPWKGTSEGVLRGPDMLDMYVTVQEFERTT